MQHKKLNGKPRDVSKVGELCLKNEARGINSLLGETQKVDPNYKRTRNIRDWERISNSDENGYLTDR